MRPVVALVSDFGLADSYVAEMRLAIARTVPDACVIDVSHEIPPFDRLAAAIVIERAVRRLPRGSAVAAVVDPGVGTSRRRIFGRTDRGVWLVGPDNGVLPVADIAPVYRARADVIRRDPDVHTFDGREVFAPLAALLAAGLVPELAGEAVTDFVAPVLPCNAVFETDGKERYAAGVVIALDRYGNAVSNVCLPSGVAARSARVTAPVEFAGALRTAYADVAVGECVALVGSAGRVEFAVREGRSGLAVGTGVGVVCP